MLKYDTLDIPVKNCRKLKYFQSLGYDTSGDIIKVKISDLNTGSRILIHVICDYCGSESQIFYKEYKRNISIGGKYACCKECGSLKAKQTNLEKYGVENSMCLIETQEKVKKTNLDKYGVEYLQQSNDIKEKTKASVLEKYGVDHISKTKEMRLRSSEWMVSNEFKLKSKNTLLKNYNVTNPSKSEMIKEKIKNTISNFSDKDWDRINFKIKNTKLERWGDENYNNVEKVKEFFSNLTNEEKLKILSKSKATKLERWGDENYNNIEKIKESLSKFSDEDWDRINFKIKKTKLERWGDENYNNIEKIKEFFSNLTNEEKLKILSKSKYTKLERWGDENYNNIEKIKESLSKFTSDKWIEISNNRKKTNFDKYGTDVIYKNEYFRRINFEIAKNKNYIKYIDNSTSLFSCEKGHEFEIKTDNYFTRMKGNLPLCTICYPIGDKQSIKEDELYNYIKSIYNGEIIRSYREGLEIDIYLPNLNIGFEFNGLYWHSDEFKDKWYHLNKTKYFQERNIRIIHIWEDDWVNRNKIIKSQIKNWLNLTDKKIFARKCKVIEILDPKISNNFLEENHIQGKVNSSLKLGLYYDNELLSIMTFDHFEGRKKMKNNEWNINRFCNKIDYNVIGGASKLFKYFIKNYETFRVISYADRDWSQGDLYNKLGFNKLSYSDPDYRYIFKDNRINKSRFRKSNTGISESKLKINKIWDCGKIKYEKIIKK